MKTAGQLIRETRLKKNLSRNELGEMTHIRTSFITAIEESKWNSLPDLSIVTGFVKSISHFLDIDDNLSIALLKREYKLPQLVKEKSQKYGKTFVWGPRLTFLLSIVIIIAIVVGYLGLQYKKFNSPPKLTVDQPVAGQKVQEGVLTVIGSTDQDATVEINNQPIVIESNGNFVAQIQVNENTTQIKVVAKSRSGKETVLSRTISVIP